MNAAETCATPVVLRQKGWGAADEASGTCSLLSPLVTASLMLDHFCACEQLLAQLLSDVHTWTRLAGVDTPVTPQVASSCQSVLLPPSAVDGEKSRPQPHEVAEMLRRLPTVLAEMQDALAACQRELHAALMQQTSIFASSTAASCGVSNANTPRNAHQSHTHVVMGCHSATSVTVLRETPVAVAAAPASSVVSCAVSRLETGTRSATSTPSAQSQLEQRQQHPEPSGSEMVPRRMAWPAEQFCYIVHVEFKRGRLRRFFNPVPVPLHTYVLVPGDGGYDCGIVIQCGLWNPLRKAFDTDTIRGEDPVVHQPGTHRTIMGMLRIATEEEENLFLRTQLSKEYAAASTCREVVERLGLPMTVLDCEYQFDGTKITFFFSSNHMIDFRHLTHELYRIFKARIWMQNTNGTVRNFAPNGAVTTHPWRRHPGHPHSDG